MKKSFRTGLIVWVILSLAAVGCGADGGQKAESPDQQVLQLNVEQEPTSLDPALAFDFNSMDVVHSMFEGLMRLDENEVPQPAAAKNVEVSDDKQTYTFTLRDGLKWSNGEKLTAQDFEYAWKRVLDPETGSPAAFLLFFIENAEEYNSGGADADQVGVEALDEKTLKVKLGQPTPFFKQLVCYTVYSPVYQNGVEKEKNAFSNAESFVGNGAFKMEKWKHDDRIKVVKNENYWQADRVKLDGIHWAMSAEEATAYQQYKSGEFHMLYDTSIPPELKSSLIQKGEVKVTPGSGLEFFRFNVDKEPFNNKKIRRAFALAVDRQSIVNHVIQGQEKPALAYVPPGVKTEVGDFREKGGNILKDARYEEAKKLLKEGMEEEGWDKLPEVTLLYSTSDKNKEQAEAIQEMYREHLDVSIKLQNQESKVFFENQRNKNYQFSRSSFLADYNDPYNYLESFQTDHPVNRTNWSDEKYDELLEKAYQEKDEIQRLDYLHQAEEILIEEAPIFPVYYYNDLILEKPKVKHLIRHQVGPNDYTFVEIEKK
ncbi:peptide ABC transporter substrate-binding protein [Paludifilum halophilum]|nr:peptide ABC transporter substrate-binding protein [Paludifilum halophilum]